jgi:hypothetical protein
LKETYNASDLVLVDGLAKLSSMAPKRVHRFIFWDAVDSRCNGGPPEDQSIKVWDLCPNGVMGLIRTKSQHYIALETMYSSTGDTINGGMMTQMGRWNTLSEQKCGTFNWDILHPEFNYLLCIYKGLQTWGA